MFYRSLHTASSGLTAHVHLKLQERLSSPLARALATIHDMMLATRWSTTPSSKCPWAIMSVAKGRSLEGSHAVARRQPGFRLAPFGQIVGNVADRIVCGGTASISEKDPSGIGQRASNIVHGRPNNNDMTRFVMRVIA